MPQPYIRNIRMTLGPLGGVKNDFEESRRGDVIQIFSDGSRNSMRVDVSVNTSIMGIPECSTFTIYNLRASTRQAIQRGLTKIVVEAGWRNMGMSKIFQGSIMSVVHARSGTEITTTISALPGYASLATAVASKSFAKKTPVKDVITKVCETLPGVTSKNIVMEGIEGFIGNRGWNFAGKASDALTELANQFGFSWHIENGQMHIIKDGKSSGQEIKTSETGGLISVAPILNGPFQITSGVKIQMYWTPNLMAGRPVNVKSTVSPDLNGSYTIHKCTSNLSTFSDDWTADIESFRMF